MGRRADDAAQPRPSSWKIRGRKVATWVAVALLSAFALYVVAINVFLSTSLFGRALNGDPDTIFITYERGWSLWPGTVHARKLVIRSQDTHIQFLLRIEECTFDISFFDLAVAKKFHLTKVRGSGVTFDSRQKLDSPDATPEHVEALPPIAGFDRIPLKALLTDEARAEAHRQRWNDDAWHLWTVQLDDVVAEDVRSVWVDTLRFEGDARITGGFYLKPIRSARISDIHLTVRSGRTTMSDRVMVDPMRGEATLFLESFDPRTIEGPDLLHKLSFTTDLQGRVPDLANVPEALTGPVKMQGAGEIRRLALRVEGGRVVHDSHVDIGLPGATVSVLGHRVKGDLSVLGDVPVAPGAPRLALRVEARGIDADRTTPGIEAVLFHAAAIDVAGDATSLDLADPLRDLHVVLGLPSGELPDARALTAYVPPDTAFGFEGGRAKASAEVELWLGERRAKGKGNLTAADLDLRIAKTRLVGATNIDARFDSWRWEEKRLEGVHAKVHVATGWIATRNAPKTHLVDVRGFDIAIDAPEADLADPMRAFEATVDMPHNEIVDRGLLHAYLPKGKAMKVAKGHARFDARGALKVKDHKGAGTLDLHAARFGFELDELGLRADLKAHARVHDWAWEHGDLVLDDATVDVTKIEADKRSAAGAGGRGGAALSIAKIALHAKSNRFSFSKPLGRLDLDAAISGGDLKDPVALNAFLPKGADVLFDVEPGGARFDASAHARIDARVARGTIEARGRGIGARGKKIGVRGDVEVSADITEWRLDDDRMKVNSSRLAVDHAAARLGEDKPREGAPDIQAKHIELRASAPLLDLAHPSLRGVDYRLVVSGGAMPDATRLGALFSPDDAKVFAVESGKARLSADIQVTASKREARGGAELVLENAGVRFHATHLSGEFAVHGIVKGLLPDASYVDVSGSKITMRQVRATGANAETAAWSGDVVLLDGAVRVSESPAFDGFVQIKADNAKPILAMALGKSLPKFVVGMLNAPELSGQARITVEPGRSAIRDLHVRGGDVVAYGDYVVRGDRVRGEVVVAKGALSAGVNVDDSGTYVRLFDLETWRKRQKAQTLALFGESGPEGRAAAEAEAKATAEAKARAKAKAEADTKAKAQPQPAP